jgi:hypothetical protein
MKAAAVTFVVAMGAVLALVGRSAWFEGRDLWPFTLCSMALAGIVAVVDTRLRPLAGLRNSRPFVNKTAEWAILIAVSIVLGIVSSGFVASVGVAIGVAAAPLRYIWTSAALAGFVGARATVRPRNVLLTVWIFALLLAAPVWRVEFWLMNRWLSAECHPPGSAPSIEPGRKRQRGQELAYRLESDMIGS